MRLQFNAKLYRVEPAYRDDNSHLWIDEPEAVDASAPPDGAPDTEAPTIARPSTHAAPQTWVAYPEWDRLVARYRPSWTRVFERLPELSGSPGDARRLGVALQERAAVSRGLASRLVAQQRAQAGARPQRAPVGDDFDPGALVDAARRRAAPCHGRAGAPARAPPAALAAAIGQAGRGGR